VINIVSGKEIDENAINNTIKSYTKGTFINPNELQSIIQTIPYDKYSLHLMIREFIAVCTEGSDILVYKKEHYDAVLAVLTIFCN